MELTRPSYACVFVVTDYETNEVFEEVIEGNANDAVEFLRKEYPKYSKFVLKGFETEGNFIPVDLETDNIAKR